MQLKYFDIVQPVPDDITISKRRTKAIIPFLFLLVFTFFWYYGLLYQTGQDEAATFWERLENMVSETPALLIFLLAPIFFLLPQLLKYGREMFSGEQFHFNGGRGTIERGAHYLASFSDVESLHRLSNGAKQLNQLKLLLRNGSEYLIAYDGNSQAIGQLAETLATLIACPIEEHPLAEQKPRRYMDDVD